MSNLSKIRHIQVSENGGNFRNVHKVRQKFEFCDKIMKKNKKRDIRYGQDLHQKAG